MQLRLTVHATGPDLVASRLDGAPHSRWPITPTDALVELERLEQVPPPEPTGPHLWSLSTLDEALGRQGYRRLGHWTSSPCGPTCQIATATT